MKLTTFVSDILHILRNHYKKKKMIESNHLNSNTIYIFESDGF